MGRIIVTRSGGLGRITLDAPATLNALTTAMVLGIADTLDAWRADPEIRQILIDGNGPRAFCAGGDVAALHDAAIAGDHATARGFWQAEYGLNLALARYPKPIIALVHGFCLGGGVGLAGHVPYRIVGETARIAMPECAIGLIPDVGGTALLTRAPQGIGVWLALTGARLEPRGAIAAGFADAMVPEENWTDLRDAFASEGIATVLPRFARPAIGADLPAHPLREAFGAGDLAAITRALHELDDPAAKAALAAMEKASPLALQVALALQRDLTPKGDLRAALVAEYRAVIHALEAGDFIEGVRARLIDRDHAPRWRHASPDAVPPAEIAAAFIPAPGEESLF